MGYLENSYTNSNNGGSVNSQDSLWQMKMAAAANNSINQAAHHVDRQNSYGYDPITHGGYGAVDDYAPYPHITTQSNHGDDYVRNSNNPSRQDYCSDPYAAVHKPKKRMEQHIGEYCSAISMGTNLDISFSFFCVLINNQRCSKVNNFTNRIDVILFEHLWYLLPSLLYVICTTWKAVVCAFVLWSQNLLHRTNMFTSA